MVILYRMESVVPHLLRIRRQCAEWPAYGIHRRVRTGFHFRTFHWNALRRQYEFFFLAHDNLKIDAWWNTSVFCTWSGCSEIVPAGFALILFTLPCQSFLFKVMKTSFWIGISPSTISSRFFSCKQCHDCGQRAHCKLHFANGKLT